MNQEKVLKQISEMNNTESLEMLSQEIDKAITDKQNQMTMMQGEIRGLASVKRLLYVILNSTKSEGVQESVREEIENLKENKIIPQESEAEKERKERLANGKCSFKAKKSDGGKWCRRTLKTKEEKESGYCKTHMNKLGLTE